MISFSHEFPHETGLRYLNHAAVAPWPKRAADAVAAFARENIQIGARDYPQWLNIEKSLRERLAHLLNAQTTGDIALVKNTSEALSFVAFGLDWRAGDQVVISDQEFPSNRVVWEALKPRGVEILQVNLDGENPEGDLLAACTPRTRLLSISAVQYASGLRMDLERLGAGCRKRGVLFCIDAIQQLGAQPFDVQAYDCAFAMADGHKWLLGPEGLGVFYCRAAEREQLALHEYGWHMLENAGNYDLAEWQPARSARRFECGSPNMLGAVALNASLSLLEEVGMDRVGTLVEERVQQFQDGLTRISAARLHSPQNPERRAGILTFSLDGWDNARLLERLRREQVVCIQRGAGIRISPHFYTPASVIDETLALIANLARE
ncbi:aminotransferase class V-fold PLP-dependent enzyme [Pseudomonas sp. ZM23]|uniref:Aminotransferase class V-fold PLP-dependent enzyme n=1 Tax=Pseudomonas triclosanedens TaxID=2961893 RepID=A0ABY6ZSK7_9PSED|nr:aminotransferase class V-fold PLP-dependent enzyme [Pseudomonas triclosanedens]MCP8466737.1 aminotransferase class V-fold PLP-dependent enzyme [Pseudomonas triclosanedens]MCP8471908.1 aminotransferase class V-fold PLP-dependent enzyme [Pseudomonas triclosanedens]MCP8474708.1 aminotransferase class V-fold PLP-dependent enzyme [Pseudomonas triclosanedens]WAI47922.1 aminotransferase class V-fold PLP-dependent enzyme [Pseudomonas triclosanedens]